MTQPQTIVLYSSHQLYYSIARTNLDQGRKHEEQLKLNDIINERIEDWLVKANGRPDPENTGMADRERILLLEKRCQSLTQACVFAAMTAEAFINFYPRWRSQPGSFVDAVDKLPLESKWLVTPALVNGGRRLEPGEQPMQGLDFLVTTRNKLVHSRPKAAVRIEQGEIETSQSIIDDYYGISFKVAERCVTAVRLLVTALRSIDTRVTTDWLDEDRFQGLFTAEWASK